MPTLLTLEVSPRGDRSISRALGKHFVEDWQSHNPGGTVIHRDLNASHIPYIANDWIAGVYAPPDVERLAPGWPGMLENKRASLIVVSRDTYDAGQLSEADDHVTPVLRKALSFMGINDIGVVRAGENLAVTLGKVRIEDHLERYAPEVAAMAES